MPVKFEFTGDTVADAHAAMRAALDSPLTPFGVKAGLNDMPFQEIMVLIGERAEAEGYDMEVWQKGSRPEPELPLAEKKKEEARAKLRGELVASLAEATHAAAPVKAEVEAEMEAPKPTKAAPRKTAAKPASNGKTESDEERKQRIIVQLQEMYTAGRKADVNKLLAEYGKGTRTFSAIPAEEFKAIESALETL
jgi:hypothetical protein